MIISRIISFFFPHHCIVCETPGVLLCDECTHQLPIHVRYLCPICHHETIAGSICIRCGLERRHSSLDRLIVITNYKHAPIKRLIKAFKYAYVTDAMPIITHIIGQVTGALYLPANTLCTSIPLRRLRKISRPYNHSQEIARILSKASGLPYQDLLKKHRNTKHQAKLQRPDRIKNVHNSLTSQAPLAYNQPIAIIDDVVTTGATMEEAARALKLAGAPIVIGIGLAHD